MRKEQLIFLFLLIILSGTVIAQGTTNNIPIGLKKIMDYNNSHTQDLNTKISFFIAFFAGMLVILSPCVLPLFPAYFSYAFKEKENITKMTMIFFLGFSAVFVSMGIIAGFVGAQTLIVMQPKWLIMIAGAFMIMMGIFSFTEKKVCNFINLGQRFKNDIPGTFVFGVFFAIGWTACLGPILAGILAISAILGNIWKAAVLMFFYSLGNLVPLLILSMLYDRIKKRHPSLFLSKYIYLKLLGKEFNVSLTSLISGIFFIILGSVLLLFQGTGIVNTWDFLGTKQYFYSIQNNMLSWAYINQLSLGLLILFVLGLIVFFWKKRKK